MDQYLEWLGYQVKDKVTGFTGVASSIGIDLYGCVQAIVTPPYVVDEKTGSRRQDDSRWFDLTRLERQGSARVMERIIPRAESTPGGFDKPTY